MGEPLSGPLWPCAGTCWIIQWIIWGGWLVLTASNLSFSSIFLNFNSIAYFFSAHLNAYKLSWLWPVLRAAASSPASKSLIIINLLLLLLFTIHWRNVKDADDVNNRSFDWWRQTTTALGQGEHSLATNKLWRFPVGRMNMATSNSLGQQVELEPVKTKRTRAGELRRRKERIRCTDLLTKPGPLFN